MEFRIATAAFCWQTAGGGGGSNSMESGNTRLKLAVPLSSWYFWKSLLPWKKVLMRVRNGQRCPRMVAACPYCIHEEPSGSMAGHSCGLNRAGPEGTQLPRLAQITNPLCSLPLLSGSNSPGASCRERSSPIRDLYLD